MAVVTAKQIARQLGISASAVSLALNGKPGVSEATRSQVLSLASQLGYTKAELSAGQPASRTICFVRYANQIVNIAENTSFSSFVLQGVEAQASALGYSTQVRYLSAGDIGSQQIVEKLRAAAGLVFLGTDVTEAQLPMIEGFLDALGDTPMVVVDSFLLADRVDCVGNDSLGGARSAVEYLLQSGHRRIGYLRANQRIANFHERESGVLAALGSWDLPLAAAVDVDVSSEGAVRDFEAWLARGERLPDAFFAENDVIAAAAIRVLKKHGYVVPGDVSIIGFDNIPICEMIEPPLSTVRAHMDQLGAVAVEHLHRRIVRGEIPHSNQSACRLRTILSTGLCIRSSTGPASTDN